MYFSSRFGRSPRPDEKLDAALKGLPGDATLYHYSASAAHLLVGPMGIWVLVPFSQRGTVTFSRDRWRIKGGGFTQAYMSLFGQEGLGRPDAEAAGQIQAVKKDLAKCLGDESVPEINAALVFTNDEAEIQAEGAPLPTLHAKKLKDFIRQKAKDLPLRSDVTDRVTNCLTRGTAA
jgi:hypothetical protein